MKKTKIQYCSDLHLEFQENTAEMKMNPLVPSGGILILAGDIMLLGNMKKHDWFLDWASGHYETVYWIPGNHEYYGGYSIEANDISFEEKIRPNVILLNNRSVVHNNTAIHFSTLWGSIGFLYEKKVQSGVSDFYQIRYKSGPLKVSGFNAMHMEALHFLDSAHQKHKGMDSIVVTHHVPTFENYPAEFLGSPINGAFATELSGLIKKWKPNYWIYGHHHRNVKPFKVGKTTLLTNQFGYVQEGLTTFDRGCTASI